MKTRIWLLGVLTLAICTGRAPAAEWFVATNGSDAAAGTNWATAKLTIQAGVDAAEVGDVVWVSNGVYATGGRTANGTNINRAAIDKPIRVQSIHGPAATLIDGLGRDRCAYLTNGATLSGFTLTNGYARSADPATQVDPDSYGGGAYCEDGAMLTNCFLVMNLAFERGGGAHGGALVDCTLIGNSAYWVGGGANNASMLNCLCRDNFASMGGGGAFGSTLSHCTVSDNTGAYGGGASSCTLDDCLILNNEASDLGGGIWGGTLQRCIVQGNRSRYSGGGGAAAAVLNYCLVVGNYAVQNNPRDVAPGGGAQNCTLVNCTVVDNVATNGGGVSGGTASNCIVYDNVASNGPNHVNAAISFSCTTPDPGGTGNVTNDPLFVDSGTGDFRLATDSPCVNVGDNALVTGAVDLDGNPRIVNAFVDMGAYEYQAEGGTVLIAVPVRTNVGDGAASKLAIEVTANVAWTASTNVPWLAITSGKSGATNGTVLFAVAANAGAARTGAVVVVGSGLARTCTVVQAGFVPALAVSPASTNVGSGGASGLTLGVTADVAWTAATNAPWLAISSGASGTTNGTVLFDVAANAGVARTGAVIVAGGGLSRTCTVIQAAFVPALAISPASTNLGFGAASGLAIGVTANVAWTAATNVPWVAISSGESGATNGTVLFDVAANAGAARTGAVIVVGGGLARTCRVVQAAFVPALSVSPASTNVGSGGVSGLAIGVTANVAWIAATNVPWLAIISGASGTTNGTVVFSVATNSGASRTGRIVVAGAGLSRTCRVVQAAFVPALSVSPASTNVGSGGVSGLAIGVTANVAWTAATNVSWLAISSGELGVTNGTVVFSVTANAGAARMGRIVVAGGGLSRTCTVTQTRNPAYVENWYVATNGNNAAAGTNWPTAKQTIQAAVDAAEACDAVWVSNGIYATGGRAVYGGMTNRVAIDKPLTVQSVSGPDETILLGGLATRCAYVGTNAVLSGFTLTNGATRNVEFADHAREKSGGGAWCENSGVVSNCVLSGNSAGSYGGGAYGGTLRNCALKGNSASWGGGAHGAALWSCEVSGNSVTIGGSGGGVDSCTANLCVLSGNTADVSGGGGAFESTLNNCIVSDNRALIGGGTYAGSVNNCVIIGNWAGSGFPDDGTGGGGSAGGTLINCIVYGNGATSGSNYLSSAFQHSCTAPDPGGTDNITSDPRFVDAGAGNYRLQAGSPCINAGDNAAAPGAVDLDGNPRIIFGTVDMGAYEFMHQHVAPGGSDGADGISWATAKQTIQAAVDATTNGCIVWVSNGVYATGGRAVDGALTNRVAIDRPIIVQSVNGPATTIIQGSVENGVRCAYVGSNSVLSSFTLTNGRAYQVGERYAGGGALIAGGRVEHCVISGNYALTGAGASIVGAGTLSHCRVIGNSAGDTGGGGGVFSSNAGQVVDCLIADNYAEWAPGVLNLGGGMELINCTISANASFGGPAVVAPTSMLWNCIVYSNNVDTGHQEIEGDPVVLHSCSPGLSGHGNVAADPQFVDAAAGNYRLLATSPCLDAGDDSVVQWDEDLDGNQRIVYGAVDMGAYEAQLSGVGTWFGAITNGLTNDLDCAAGDGMPNLLKYATGGSPRVADDNEFVGGSWSGLWPILTFHRNPNATDVRFVVESAETMASGAVWRGVATNVGGSWLGATNVAESGTGNPVECTVTDPVALDSNRFLRLKISRP